LSCSRSAKGMNAAVRTKAKGGVPQMAACLSAHVIPGRAISTRSHIRRDSPFVTTTSRDRGCNSLSGLPRARMPYWARVCLEDTELVVANLHVEIFELYFRYLPRVALAPMISPSRKL
jgi:hypothetical protein